MLAFHAGGSGSNPDADALAHADGIRDWRYERRLQRFDSSRGYDTGGASARLRLISAAWWGQHPPPVSELRPMAGPRSYKPQTGVRFPQLGPLLSSSSGEDIRLSTGVGEFDPRRER